MEEIFLVYSFLHWEDDLIEFKGRGLGYEGWMYNH